MKKIYLIIILITTILHATAQEKAGTPDSSFGVNAVKVINTADSLGNLQLKKLVILPNNKILTLLGYSGGAIIRNKPNGRIDSSFCINGLLAVPGVTLYNFAVQNDGKILTAGISNHIGWVVVYRFLPNGKVDSLFGRNGITTIYIGDGGTAEPGALALQRDGKIVVAGTLAEGTGGYYGYAVRFLANGKVDKSFGTGGKTLFPGNTDIQDLKIQKTGNIVCGGSIYSGISNKFYVSRLLTNGQKDESFGSHGEAVTDLGAGDHFLHELALQPDDKIIATGVAGTDLFNGIMPKLAVVRYNSNGDLDKSFDSDGVALLHVNNYRTQGNTVVVQKDGKIIAGGWIANSEASYLLLARFNSNGSLDSSFGVKGGSKTYVTGNDQIVDIGLQSNGKIVAGGTNGTNILIRYFGDSNIFKKPQFVNPSSIALKNKGNKTELNLILSPNPVTDELKISGLPANQKSMVNILKSNGDIILSGNCSTSTFRINISSLRPGLYAAVITAKGLKQTLKFVKL